MSPRRGRRGGAGRGRPRQEQAAPHPAQPPQGGRDAREIRNPEPAHESLPLEDEELLGDEIRAHREIAADARAAAATANPQAVAAFGAFLRALGIDSRRDPEYTVTAQLTADFLAERTAALRREPAPIRPSRYHGQPGETVRLERIPVYGMCPHHLVPYFGSAKVSYVPSDRIAGIGAIARLVRELSCVPRLQERLTQDIADAIQRDLEPTSVEVTIRARHLCLEMRGVEQKAIFMTEARRSGAPGHERGGPRQRSEGRR